MGSTTRLRRYAAASALACALAVSACGEAPPDAGGPSSAAPEPTAGASSTTPSGTPTGTAGDGPLVADPEHAVPPPGPRKGTLVPPDLLVKSREPIPDELIDEIEALPKVKDAERITLADVGIQDRVINVAAVDPGTYRNYTRIESAELQEQWDRVAGGEVALSDTLGTRMVDREGWVQLGNDEDAPRVHVGATAPQVPQVDAVVNEKWGEEFGMPMGNALLVTTGINAPGDVVPQVQRLVGDVGAVSILGPDLDVGAFQSAVLTGGSVAEAVGTFRYTVLGGGRIQPDRAWVDAHIRTEQVPILGRVTCHEVMLPQFRAALTEVQQRGLADKIHPGEYAGCYYPRYIAGTQQLSLHSFGIAVDLNVPGNQRGTVGEIDRTVVAIFKKWGFAWGGDWSWTDPMHFEMSRLVEPG